MKVLFAVSNDNVSNSIIKKYQQKYKEIITSKNVYYFNAIIKELQKDKSYDIVVIGEDLEPISNNNYDTVDKFLFEKLDNISDEAYKNTGEDIPIILICSDRRTKSDELLVKLFGIGIYNALLGNDRNVETVCNLINKPRSKKEAKSYYKIDSEDVGYRPPESEMEVSETEIQNILNHYKKIGNNEKKCVESFDSIASQYNDTQLRIIVKFLPMNVKAILESKSEKYHKLMTGGTVLTNGKYNQYQPPQRTIKSKDMDLLTKDLEKTKLTKPVIIPSTMDIEKANVQRSNPVNMPRQAAPVQNVVQNRQEPIEQFNPYEQMQQFGQIEPPRQTSSNTTVSQVNPIEPIAPIETEKQVQEVVGVEEKPKRRGRPKKINTEEVETNAQAEQPVKRGRGRPKKVVAEQPEETSKTSDDAINLFDLGDVDTNSAPQNNNVETANPTLEPEVNLFGMADDLENVNKPVEEPKQEIQSTPYAYDAQTNMAQTSEMPYNPIPTNEVPYSTVQTNDSPYSTAQANENPYNTVQPNENPYSNIGQTENIYNMGQQNYNPVQNNQTVNNVAPNMNNMYDNSYNQNPYNMNPFGTEELVKQNYQNNTVRASNFIAQNSKVLAFVGTSKNGTSFIVNNLAEFLSKKGINTAILDLTKNKNSYYMFTNNDQNLMQIAGNSIKSLSRGIAEGVQVNRNLTVFTSLPGEDSELENFDTILQTLDNNYSAVLMDCDFETNINYFTNATEIYLIQSMDALTIQPLTLFLSELKLKNALDESKLRVVINKEMKLKILTDKMILGGMAKYNEPSMTLQRDLFNPNTIKYVTIPFEEQTYARYLEAIALCQISLNGYSQRFLSSLEELANMVYPLVQGGSSSNYSGYSKYSPDYEKAKRGFFGGKNKKQTQTQFSAGVNGTLDKMRSNY